MERTEKRRDIRSMGIKELEAAAQELGEPKFRGKQMHEWIWKHSATSFEAMTNLSNAFRQKLQEHYEFRPLTIDAQQQSTDGTVKCRFKLFDGNVVEGVLIPSTERAEDRLSDRMTACLSSQVGCSLNCSFCATGFMDLKRNLEPAEIYDQVVMLNRISQQVHGSPLTNIVFMGMGEPLLNYRNVLGAIERITAPDGLNISAKRITVSTAGIAKMIRRLGDDEVRFNLALSLHHTHDEARSKIMPINESNSLDALVDALNYFYDKTGGRITFEYILFDGLNESKEDAERLVQLCRRVPAARVNIIEYNPIDMARFQKSEQQRRERFVDYLHQHRVTAKVRRSRGKDIDAACGQLANK
ncbi:MAG: 23S rRNA (adenine(2503)-C(2))-methyltransferase RlmN [Bacteroidetes bacterium]|nr:23S rRNA (adenine(2503)-C(2))-methyltransferase RlmN [Bacteroidota bacterium]